MRRARSAALSLVEVLVAISMLAIISASVVAFLPTIVTMNRDASNEQDVTIASKLFFEAAAGLASPSALVDGSYGGGETVAGSDVTVPFECRAIVSRPLEGISIKRLVLSCDDTVDQVLEFGAAS